MAAKTLYNEDFIAPGPLNRMSFTLNDDTRFSDGHPVPKLWHWLFFLPDFKTAEAGPDGHAKTGGFIPAMEGLDRRMWAGSRLEFHNDLICGRHARRASYIKQVNRKTGRSGELGFVTVVHEITQNARPVLTEEHDIVYKKAPRQPVTEASVNAGLSPAEKAPLWSQTIRPDPLLLFRYSALTFNGHRIHYDRDFCKADFGFPGLVVHGPLIATLMIELVRKHLPEADIRHYAFRAKGPVFDFQTFTVQGCRQDDTVDLWTANPGGFATMSAKALI